MSTTDDNQIMDKGFHGNESAKELSRHFYVNIVGNWLSSLMFACENVENLVMYGVLAICIGVILLLLFIIIFLVYIRPTLRRHSRQHVVISSEYSKSKSTSKRRTPFSSTSTQTSPENLFLLPVDSPDRVTDSSPFWPPPSPDGTGARLAESSSPSTMRTLPLRVYPDTPLVGSGWNTLDGNSRSSRSSNTAADLYTNPYRKDTLRTIDSRVGRNSTHKS